MRGKEEKRVALEPLRPGRCARAQITLEPPLKRSRFDTRKIQSPLIRFSSSSLCLFSLVCWLVRMNRLGFSLLNEVSCRLEPSVPRKSRKNGKRRVHSHGPIPLLLDVFLFQHLSASRVHSGWSFWCPSDLSPPLVILWILPPHERRVDL
ncbi:hypothetical protein FB45DRAFT_336070 [Roridomyces roridus]|uniref:Uncharacterized protein n=1 Tax=Roridomyces roridus TaxID=1738132 RepID=A0AAD7B431_9AGAR|nr:hypothetical protein FB45DRAFT_336070 [Roridomyces roridus]